VARLSLILVVAALLPVVASAAAPPVLAKVPTGPAPCGAASAFGSIWVAVYGTGRLVRIDPHSNRVVHRIRVGRGICPVTSAAGSIWVASDKTDLVYRVDPPTGRILARVRVSHWPAHLAAGPGKVWVSSFEHRHVTEISTRTNRTTRVYRFPGNPSGLARTGGVLWVAFGRTGKTLARVDIATHAITYVPIGHAGAGFLSAVGGSLWTTTSDGYAVRINPGDGRVMASFPILGTPAEVAAAPDGTIWVAEKERDTITRIDPGVNRIVDVTSAGDGAFSIAVAGGDMWVTNFAGADVWRFAGRRR
jgi:streptogramin lyase